MGERSDRRRPRSEVIDTLRQAGVAPQTLEQLERELPETVDRDRDGHLLHRHGIDRDALTDRMGGSP